MGVIGRGLVLGERYRLIRRLRSERSGDVWEADDRLWQRVTLTLIAPDLSGDELFLEHLRRDVRLAAWPFLSHPNIARIFLHRAEAGIHYVVTEPLNGETVAERLEKGALSREVATRIAALAADALDAAHMSGIVHGALRPDRLLFSPSEGLKLIGFGVDHAAAVSDLARGSVETWESPYLAPEQRRDGAARPASDVYALARVLVEMLTYAHPERVTDAAGSGDDHRGEGEPASKLPPDLALLIDEAMSRHEAARPSAKRFAARLRHPAAQPSVGQPFVRPWEAVPGRSASSKEDHHGRPPTGTAWNPFALDDQASRARPAKATGSGLQPLGQLFGDSATQKGPDQVGRASAVGWKISERDVWARRADGASAPAAPEKQHRPVFGLHWRSRPAEARTAWPAPPKAPAESDPSAVEAKPTPDAQALPRPEPEPILEPPQSPEPEREPPRPETAPSRLETAPASEPPRLHPSETGEVAPAVPPSPPMERVLPAASGSEAPSPTVFEALMTAKREALAKSSPKGRVAGRGLEPERIPEVQSPQPELEPASDPPWLEPSEARQVESANADPSQQVERVAPAASAPGVPSPTVFEALTEKRHLPVKASPVLQESEQRAHVPVPSATGTKMAASLGQLARSARRLAIPATLALIIVAGWVILSREGGGTEVPSASAPSPAPSSVQSSAGQPDPVPVGSIAVPDVIGLGALDARRVLEEEGLTLAEAVPVSGTPGVVVGSRPAIDAPVEPGTPIILLVGTPPDRLDAD